MRLFIGSVYAALHEARWTDATLTPQAVFDELRKEIARSGVPEGVDLDSRLLGEIYQRPPADIARAEAAIGSSIKTLTLSEATVERMRDALVDWFLPKVRRAEWLTNELDSVLKGRGVADVPSEAELTQAAIEVRDSFSSRIRKHLLLADAGDDLAPLCARAYEAIPAELRKEPGVGAAFAVNLESLMEFGVPISPEPQTSPRLQWIASAIEEGPAKYESAHRSLQLVSEAGINRESVSKFLLTGIHHQPSLGRAPLLNASATQRAAYFARLRDVNNVMFTQMCFDLADRMGATAPSSFAIADPTLRRYAELTQQQFVVGGNNTSTTQAFEASRAAAPEKFARVTSCFIPAEFAPGDGLSGRSDFYVRFPVGEFGDPLARAISDACSIAVDAARALAAEIDADPTAALVAPVLNATTLLRRYDAILVEGVVSIAQTLALLLAKKPASPYDTADAALQLVDAGKLVTQIAGMAPFGVVGPMANLGVVPGEALGIVSSPRGPRAQLPEGFETMLHAVHASRVAHLHHGDLTTWHRSDHANETGRGCPVAGRGPVMETGGKVVMSKDSGLTELTHQFITLTRRLLVGRASTHRAPD